MFVYENKPRHTHSASVLFYFVSTMVDKSKEPSLLVHLFDTCTVYNKYIKTVRVSGLRITQSVFPFRRSFSEQDLGKKGIRH